MAWPNTVSAGQPALASQFDGVVAALQLWGGAVSAGGYPLTNLSAVGLNSANASWQEFQFVVTPGATQSADVFAMQYNLRASATAPDNWQNILSATAAGVVTFSSASLPTLSGTNNFTGYSTFSSGQPKSTTGTAFSATSSDASNPSQLAFQQMGAATGWNIQSINQGIGYTTVSLNSAGGSVLVGAGGLAVGGIAPLNMLTVAADLSPQYGYTSGQEANAQLILCGKSNSNKQLRLGFDTTNNVAVIDTTIFGSTTNPLLLNPTGGVVIHGTSANNGAAFQVAGSATFASTLAVTGAVSFSTALPIASGGIGAASFLAAGLPTLAAANTFASNTGIGVAPRATLSVGPNLDISSGGIYASTVASIGTDTSNNLFVSAHGSAALFLNYNAGTGGVNFCNGATGTVATMSAAGAGSFASLLLTTPLPITSGGTGATTFLAAGLPTLAASNAFSAVNTFGGMKIGTGWAGYAEVSASSFFNTANYFLLQYPPTGICYVNAPSGQTVNLANNGQPIATVNATGMGVGNLGGGAQCLPRTMLSVGNYLDISSGGIYASTVASIGTDTSNNLLVSAHGSAALFLNYNAGTGGVNFCNGSTGTVASISSAGAASFSSLAVSGALSGQLGGWIGWTPGCSASGGMTTTTPTTTTATNYIKIGPLVHFRVRFTTTLGGTMGTSVTVTGIPVAESSGLPVMLAVNVNGLGSAINAWLISSTITINNSVVLTAGSNTFSLNGTYQWE